MPTPASLTSSPSNPPTWSRRMLELDRYKQETDNTPLFPRPPLDQVSARARTYSRRRAVGAAAVAAAVVLVIAATTFAITARSRAITSASHGALPVNHARIVGTRAYDHNAL